MADQEIQSDVPDRRETIEAAFEAAESGAAGDTSTPAPAPADKPAAEQVPAEAGESAPAEPSDETPASETAPKAEAAPPAPAGDDKAANIERAPQAWKAPLKAKWDKLDPDIRQEISRRERETTAVLNETAQARQLTHAFVEAVKPYQARLTQLGAHPIQAMTQLLKADAFLSSAPTAARAKYMATLIKGYGVDIAELDAALSGSAPADPVAAKVEQLLQQRLAPVQNFMNQQTQQQRLLQQQQEQAAATTVEQMASDARYPYFNQVRGAMADLIEFMASRGQQLSMPEAYNRAIALDPAISQEIASKAASTTAATQAQQATARAKRALNASSSVSGNPGGTARSGPAATDRRATIEAAFGAAEGR